MRFKINYLFFLTAGLSMIYGIFNFTKQWGFWFFILPFMFIALVWAVVTKILSDFEQHKLIEKYFWSSLLYLVNGCIFSLTLIEIFRFVLMYLKVLTIKLNLIDLAFFIICCCEIVVLSLSEYLDKRKIREIDILKGIEYSTFPATLAAFSLAAYGLISQKALLSKLGVVSFIFSSIFILLYYWHFKSEIRKDKSLVILLRILSIGSFLAGLIFLLIIAILIEI